MGRTNETVCQMKSSEVPPGLSTAVNHGKGRSPPKQLVPCDKDIPIQKREATRCIFVSIVGLSSIMRPTTVTYKRAISWLGWHGGEFP